MASSRTLLGFGSNLLKTEAEDSVNSSKPPWFLEELGS